MNLGSFTPARPILAGATALSLALAATTQPARAEGGDITRGVLMGLAGGVILNQMAQDNWGRGRSNTYVYRSYPRHRSYYESYDTPSYGYAAPSYSYAAPAYSYVPQTSYVAPLPSSPLSQAFNSQDQRLRVSIQYRLMQAGFYNSTLDGLWGPATQNALYNYAQVHGQTAMLTNQQDANQLFGDILR
ncbi:peptidoglycan-binding domain-containing protein [Solirhodobacter olei]|uniref:peptidoglycan-binding domain-containing protein n=1 Tax=Solirhodobacter olei TaxID=2493082 RepID=UPI000FDCADC3|nr:hypothetical protein [Solirhodobacter olei]